MLLVHPVHEVLRQIPLLIGSVVLGSATDNPMWAFGALGLTVGFGVARWFTTTYRIEPSEVQLRAGVLQRKELSVPRNRIRTVSTDARLLHRLLGLTVLRVSTGQEARGDAEFALDAVQADQVPRLRAILLSDSLAADAAEDARPHGPGAGPLAAVLAALQPAEFHRAGHDRGRRRAGLSGGSRCGAGEFACRAVGAGCRAALRCRRQRCRRRGRAAGRLGRVVRCCDRWSRSETWCCAGMPTPCISSTACCGVREHTFDMRRLRGGTLREPLLVRLFGGARLDAVMTGVDGAGEASLLLPPCPAQTARGGADRTDRPARRGDRAAACARTGGHPPALDAGADRCRRFSAWRWSWRRLSSRCRCGCGRSGRC